MYEHPIKRAGLSFNRILFSNTNSVKMCFTSNRVDTKKTNRFDLSFQLRKFENGKEVSRRGKFLFIDILTILYFNL